jgi:hypothetical protein
MTSYIYKNSQYPLSNVNAKYVNADNSTWPAAFSSRATGREFGYAGISNNARAAAASGGKKPSRKSFPMKKKINNIMSKYRMPRKSKQSYSRKLKKYLKTLFSGKCCSKKSKRGGLKKTLRRRQSRKNLKGGYYQYGSNSPASHTYSTGGILPAKLSAMANPVPFQVLPCTTNCVDNYNYNTNSGFQLFGSK